MGIPSGVFTQDLKTGPHALHSNYPVICAKPLPLPQLALTACFDLLSFCRPTNFTISTIQWSAHFLHWQENSLVCFSSQLLTHFPHWYLAVGRGARERWVLVLGVGIYTYVRVSTHNPDRPLQLLKMNGKPTHTDGSWFLGGNGNMKMMKKCTSPHHNDCSYN